METKSRIVGTTEKSFDGLLIMERFSEDIDSLTKEQREREIRREAYEKRRIEDKK